jgi:hypothetical protein
MAAEISSAEKMDVAQLVNLIASVAAVNRALADESEEDQIEVRRPTWRPRTRQGSRLLSLLRGLIAWTIPDNF